MPLVSERHEVLAIYRQAAERGWVIPAFCTENLTTTEAILAAAVDHGRRLGIPDLPVTVAITNLYDHRSQTVHYTHSGCWRVGLRLFLADLEALMAEDSPYHDLQVMVHLDHIQPDRDHELLAGGLGPYASIMFDASACRFETNMALTADFVARRGCEIVIEGACDEIVDATGEQRSDLTTPERAEQFLRRTGVDMMVANLGTEHRASASELTYRGDLARQIKACIGPRLVLHGCSSITTDQIRTLFHDGICKVNLWTALERDSVPVLMGAMLENASRIAGADHARDWQAAGLLGARAIVDGKPDLGFYTTTWRQSVIFDAMKRIVGDYLELWYR